MQLWPFVVVTVGYLLLRLLTPGGFYNETVPCHTAECFFTGSLEYANRLLVRPEAFLATIWTKRLRFFVVSVGGLGLMLLLLRPWLWHSRRAIMFAAGWLVGAVFYFLYALWPYITDRFLYIPDMGPALFAGAVAAQVIAAWPKTRIVGRAVGSVVAAVVVVWVVAGVWMLWGRGEAWTQAGREAASIVDQVYSLAPNPTPGSALVLSDVPDSLSPPIPPSNTGPYIFRNGIEAALRLRYGRGDFDILNAPPPYTFDPGRQVVRISVKDSRATRLNASK